MYFGKSGHCILESTNERGGLYLSNLDFAKDVEKLNELKIKHVMTVGAKLQVSYASNPFIQEHVRYSIYDTEQDDIKQHFKSATLFLKEKILLSKENVLVHCHQGASRSASIVIAFLMKCLKWNYDRSLSHCRRIRPHVRPNPGFVIQLKSYEKELGLQNNQPNKNNKISNEISSNNNNNNISNLTNASNKVKETTTAATTTTSSSQQLQKETKNCRELERPKISNTPIVQNGYRIEESKESTIISDSTALNKKKKNKKKNTNNNNNNAMIRLGLITDSISTTENHPMISVAA